MACTRGARTDSCEWRVLGNSPCSCIVIVSMHQSSELFYFLQDILYTKFLVRISTTNFMNI